METQKAIEALRATEKGAFPFHDLARFDGKGLHLNLFGWMLKTFGASNFALRFLPALVGALTIAGLFLLARKLKFSLLTAGLASLGLTFSFWHLLISRLVLPGTFLPMILIWASLLFLFGFQKNQALAYWRNGWLFFFLVVLVSLSGTEYFHQNQLVSFFQENPAPNFLWLLPPVWIFFSAFGFLLSLKEMVWGLEKKWHQKATGRLFLPASLLQILFWTLLLPGFFSDQELPLLLKFGGILPAIFLLAAFPFEYFLLLQKKLSSSENLSLKKWREKTLKISLGGLVFIFLLTGFFQSYFFFFVWSKDQKTLASFENQYSQMGKTLRALPLKKQNFFISPPGSDISQDSSLQTIRFFGWPKINSFFFSGPTPEVLRDLPCVNTLYFFQASDPWLLQQFQEKCPAANLSQITSPDGQHQFWVLQ